MALCEAPVGWKSKLTLGAQPSYRRFLLTK